MRTSATALTVALTWAAVTGCAAAPAGPHPLAPPIPGDPIDLTAFTASPCGLLDAGQLAHYYVTAPGTVQHAACVWQPGDTTGLTYEASVDTTGGGLESLYRHRATVNGFDPATVHSYPAIHRDSHAGRCTVQVGVANDTLLTVVVEATDTALSAHQDPCGEADRFAGSIVGYQGHRAP
ncbi:DUF3558 domain-containing protein [Amycolatopsis australiensis]|uniref:DUF3558 domain-containing protein n=1 Tax=Amycolatopsis australiensis TaxID=546364 RepID=A0A1K1SPC9_9PSEU|nr:DUF3558 domain-containing protein [Amycolatopsis australiensis]SFW86177.1 Protein of unknown function [Amycolatopsis australiensis]